MENSSKDTFGQMLLAQYKNLRVKVPEIIERNDGHISVGDARRYFSKYESWSNTEKKVLGLVRGKVLDIGCGAGRHALFLQHEGFDVMGIDNSVGALRVCKLRGLKNIKFLSLTTLEKLDSNNFDSIIFMANNFALIGDEKNAKKILKTLLKITSDTGQIIIENTNPYKTLDPVHLNYQQKNKSAGRMSGQSKIRVCFKKNKGRWFNYLFLSPDELKKIIHGTGWEVEKIVYPNAVNYVAILGK